MEDNKAPLINQAELLDVLSRYFDRDKHPVTLQMISDDFKRLSGATFTVLSLLRPKRNTLTTVSVAPHIPTDNTLTRICGMVNAEWYPGSFIYKTAGTKTLLLLPPMPERETAGPASATTVNGLTSWAGNLFCLGLYIENTCIGSVLFGLPAGNTIEWPGNIEYFANQAAKLLNTYLEKNDLEVKTGIHGDMISENDTDLVFTIDRNWNILEINKSKLSSGNDKFVGKNILGFVPQNLTGVCSECITKSFNTGEIVYEEMPLYLGIDNGRFYSIKFIPIRNNLVVDVICVIATDIAGQKHLLRDFNTLQNVAKIGWWELHLPENKLTWSEGIFNLLELNPITTKANDKIYVNHIHPDDLELVIKTFKKALKDKTDYEITYRLVMKDGRVKWVLDKCISHFDDDGKQFRSLGLIQDITQLKRAELKLKHYNGLYKRLTNQVPGTIIEYQVFENGEEKLNYVSQKMSGNSHSDEREPGHELKFRWQSVHPDDLPRVKAAYADSAKSLKGINVEYRINVTNNSNQNPWRRLEATPERQADNSTIWYGYISDINGQKELEQKLVIAEQTANLSSKFLTKLTNQVPGVIFDYQISKNGERSYNFISEKIEEKAGISIEDIKQDATLIWKHIHPEDLENLKNAFAQSARTLFPINEEYRFTLPVNKGRESWQRMEALPERMEDGSTKWYGYISDIDEQKRLENKLLVAEREAKISSKFLTKLTNQVPGVIFELQISENGERKYNYVSEKVKERTGISSAELLKDPNLIRQLHHPDDQEILNSVFLANTLSLRPINVEYRVFLPIYNMKESWQRLEAVPERQTDGSTTWYGYISDIDAKKKLEKKLQVAEQEAKQTSRFLTKLTNRVPGIIFEYQANPDGSSQFNHVSDKIEIGSGIKTEELLKNAEAIWNTIDRRDIEKVKKIFDTSNRNLVPVNFDFRIIHAESKLLVWRNIEADPECLEDGTVIWSGYISDIDEQKRLEQKLLSAEKEAKEASAFLERLTNQIPGLIYELQVFPDGSSRFNYLSSKLKQRVGIDSEILKVNPFLIFEAIHEDERQTVVDLFTYSDEKCRPVNIDYKLINQRTGEINWRHLESIPERMEDGSIKWYSYTSNIQAQKETENKLMLAEKEAQSSSIYFKKIVSQIPGAVLTIKIEKRGDSVLHIFSDEEKYNRVENLNDLFSLIHPEDFQKLVHEFDHSQEMMESISLELRIRFTRSAEHSWYILQATPEKDDQGNLVFYGYLGQIDELKESQLKALKAMAESEKASKAKTEFLSNMSHEIRTPMNAILGFSELLIGNTKGPKYDAYLDGIISGGKNLLMLINDVLDLAKIESGNMEVNYKPTDINSIVGEFYHIYFQESLKKDISFFIDNNIQDTDFILMDELRIRQILFNLLGNAFKFTHSGEISLSINCTKHANSPDRVKMTIRVTDTGIGVPEKQQRVIFESFKQQQGQSNRKYGGTGLGLTITKFFVEAMNGKIYLESKVGHGSCFIVEFEDLQLIKNTRKTDEDDNSKRVVFEGQKILVVEDIASNIAVIKGFLEGRNLNIKEAENGKVALDMIAFEKPDLILMDMMMPVMSGYSATKALKMNKDLRHIPVIATTASALKHNELLISNLCDDYLRKPIVKNELIDMMSGYLSHTIEITGKHQAATQTGNPEFTFSGDLKKQLQRKFKSKYNAVLELMSIDDITTFATELRLFADEVNDSSLRSYSETLLDYAENFEIDKMNSLFTRFKTLTA